VRRDAVTKHFGHVIRTRRAKAGLSQEKLAEASGLHPTYISLVERGRRSPSLVSVQKFARGLDCSMSALISETERRMSP
jgi:transcriptional regulator with XRE-family HTH domain